MTASISLCAGTAPAGLAGLVWGALWQDFSPGNLIFGAADRGGDVQLFYLPPVELSGRFNCCRAVVFAAIFSGKWPWRASRYSGLAVTAGPKVRNAVVAVPLRSHSDLLVTATGHVISLIPGCLWWRWTGPRPRSTCTCINVRNARTQPRTPQGSARDRGRADPDHGHQGRTGTGQGRRHRQRRSSINVKSVGCPITVSACPVPGRGRALVRMARGPSLLDRVLATDVLLAIVCGAALMHRTWPSTGT